MNSFPKCASARKCPDPAYTQFACNARACDYGQVIDLSQSALRGSLVQRHLTFRHGICTVRRDVLLYLAVAAFERRRDFRLAHAVDTSLRDGISAVDRRMATGNWPAQAHRPHALVVDWAAGVFEHICRAALVVSVGAIARA
ncbi:hypothetical protein D3C80_1584500 [compost metagenome]